MSFYFERRVKNLPVSNSARENRPVEDRNSDSVITLSDDELLESVKEFEKSEQFQNIQKQVEQAKESENSTKRIHPFFDNCRSPHKEKKEDPDATKSTSEEISRLKAEISQIIGSSSKKRSANEKSDDEEIVEVGRPSIGVVRQPTKRLPKSKPDFHSFLPKNQSVTERVKTLNHNFRVAGRDPNSLTDGFIRAREQLKQREALLRKEKQNATKPTEKSDETTKKRKIEPTDSEPAKKSKTGPKNAFEKLLQETTESFNRVLITVASSMSTNTVTHSVSVTNPSSSSCLNIVSSTVDLQQKSSNSKSVKERKILNFEDYMTFILRWPISLIDENDLEKNVLFKEFLGEIENPTPVLELYESFGEYEEITLPWLLEETFEEIRRSVKMREHKLWKSEFSSVVTQVRCFRSGLFELKSQILYKRGIPNDQRPDFLCEEDLLVVTLENLQQKKVFGLIQSGERITDKHRLHKTFVDHPDVKARPVTWLCQELNIRIFGATMKIPDGSKIKIQAVASLTSTLRRFKALASMRFSPLFEHLLSPSIDDPVFQVKARTDVHLDEKYFQAYNDSQRQVISEAVSMVLETKDEDPGRIYMCQGPPGTGKSQTITGIIRALLQPILNSVPTAESSKEKSRMKILICCPSNGGCNEIVRRLIEVFGRKPAADSTGDKKETKLPFNLIRCARGAAVSEDIQSVSIDVLAQKSLENELNGGGNNDAIKRNLANKEKQKESLVRRINAEKEKNNLDELKDLQLNLKELEESIEKMKKNAMKTISDSARRKREREIKIELLRSSDVCVATLNFVGNSLFDCFCPFDSAEKLKRTENATTRKIESLFNCLVIDEAGQCIEIDSFIPLRLAMNRVILVGDPEQLPATVLSRRALDAGLNQSLFERLYRLFKYDINNPIRMLNVQYRMHDEICKFPSAHVYRSKLKTDKAIHQKRKKFPLRPYVVLDAIFGKEILDPTSQSYGNPLEAEIVVSLVQFINEKAKVPFNQIGIITPYNFQLKLIEQILDRRNFRDTKIEIGTVDAFQGRQKDVILLSCVRATQINDSASSNPTSIGFVANRQRLNVSLTRAKYAMYIIGHMESLTSSEDWEKLYRNAIERKLVFKLEREEQFELLMKGQPTENRPIETN